MQSQPLACPRALLLSTARVGWQTHRLRFPRCFGQVGASIWPLCEGSRPTIGCPPAETMEMPGKSVRGCRVVGALHSQLSCQSDEKRNARSRRWRIRPSSLIIRLGTVEERGLGVGLQDVIAIIQEMLHPTYLRPPGSHKPDRRPTLPQPKVATNRAKSSYSAPNSILSIAIPAHNAALLVVNAPCQQSLTPALSARPRHTPQTPTPRHPTT